jgi:hypothetical protein
LDSIIDFQKKLQEKGQTKSQRMQAANAVHLYLNIERENRPSGHSLGLTESAIDYPKVSNAKPPVKVPAASKSPVKKVLRNPVLPKTALLRSQKPTRRPLPTNAPIVEAKPVTGASWVEQYSRLVEEIQVRQFSPKTLKTYRQWLRQFQAFTKSKFPESLTTVDVKEFLTWLVMKNQVAASTQNQAFIALLFFYRHVLQKEFGKLEGVVRAKRKPYIPVVLSREEIDAIISHLTPPVNLVVKLLYGCGLRLFEWLNLRVQCLNFDAEKITIHDGKGKKRQDSASTRNSYSRIEKSVESCSRTAPSRSGE